MIGNGKVGRRRAARRILLLAACAGVGCGLPQPGASPFAREEETPAWTVARFLQSAGRDDYDAMARLFGTRSGPVGGQGIPTKAARERMRVIAELLRHEGYTVHPPSAPLDADGVSRVGVDFQTSGGRVADVGFSAVRGPGGRWLIREIDLAALARGGVRSPREADAPGRAPPARPTPLRPIPDE